MSLRNTKAGLLSVKNLSGGINRYCTKPIVSDQNPTIIVVANSSQRRQNELFGYDSRFPFYGGIGCAATLKQAAEKKNLRKKPINYASQKFVTSPTTTTGFLKYPLKDISEVLASQMRIHDAPNHEPEKTSIKIDLLKANRAMELVALPCPWIVKKDLRTLFVDIKIRKETPITVMNVTQKSKNDMSAWSPEMEKERDELTKDFINIAISICTDLQNLGDGKYWADFIEPSSGRPYFGSYTNSCLFETDERYREMGFQIEDLGCCKVIKHAKWATHAFIGSIFTNARMDSAEVKAVLEKSQAGQYFQAKSE